MSYQKLAKNPLFWFVIFLLCLIPLLAVLQYSWIGELSHIELERRKRDLSSSSFHFLRDLNFEILLMYTELKMGTQPSQAPDGNAFARQYLAWQKKSYFPKLLQNIYYYDAATQTGFSYKPVTAQFVPISSASLKDLVQQGTETIAAYKAAEQRYKIKLFYFFDVYQTPLLMVPVRSQTVASLPREKEKYLVLQLNLDYLAKEFLPELINSYYNTNNKQEYIIRVAANEHKSNVRPDRNPVLYESARGLPGQRELEPDFTFPLVLLIPTSPLQEDELHREESMHFPSILRLAPPPARKGEPTLIVKGKSSSDLTGPWERWALLMRTMAAELELTPPLLESVNIISHELSAFNLQVYHQSGSLEISVNYIQIRNVLISTGILILLGVSLILLLISYQKDKILTFKEKEFIATVTHELNTPLAVICSAGENLAKGIVTDKNRLVEYGELIKKEGFRLNKMVESILLYSGMQTRRLVKQKDLLPVDELLDQVIARFEFQLANQGIKLQKEVAADLPPLYAIKDLVLSVIDNVLSNAIKHGGQGGRIELKALKISTKLQHPVLEIQVGDHGPGIPKNELSHIFEPFFRGEAARTNQVQGSGLGLSLVKKILDALKGQIKVISQPGKGTCCIIHIPYETREKYEPT